MYFDRMLIVSIWLASLIVLIFLINKTNSLEHEQTSTAAVTSYAIKNITNSTLEDPNEILKKAFYEMLGRNLIIIISPILLALGGIGNPLCILILLSKKNKNSTVIYFCVLAAFDILVLYTVI
jgi:hypothetical protein